MARKRRKSALGEVRHRKWFQAPSYKKRDTGRHEPWRKVSASVEVRRRPGGDMGEGGPAKPYQAFICVGARAQPAGYRHGIPRTGARCGKARGKTPTQAIKAALRDVAKSFK